MDILESRWSPSYTCNLKERWYNVIGIVLLVISSTWFADIVETIGLTIFALNSLTIVISGTDTSESLITVGIGLTLVWDLLASIGVGVTEVSGLN